MSRVLLLTLALWLGAAAAGTAAERLLPSRELRARLAAHVDRAGEAPGVVVGVLDAGGRRILAYGESGDPARPRIDGTTWFEIGSITKVFTAIAFADMLARGEVRADQPIGELFPRGIALRPELAAITLEELASHRSGLPSFPLDPRTLWYGVKYDNPGLGVSPERLLRTVAALSPQWLGRRGEYAYSNLGMALLGQLLARRAGRDYAALLRERVFAPLHLRALPADPDAVPGPRALGRMRNGRPAEASRLDGYAPAGGLWANADALLDFAERALGAREGPLHEALRARFPADVEGRRVGYAWHQDRIAHYQVAWQSGSTPGFRSVIALVPAHGLAVVVLSNGQANVDALAIGLLYPTPLPQQRHRAWLWLALTALGLLAAPGLPLAGLRRRPAQARDRVGALTRLGGAGVVLLLLQSFGNWLDLPYALWWWALGLTALAGLALLWQMRRLPWRGPGRCFHWRVAGFALTAVLFALLL